MDKTVSDLLASGKKYPVPQKEQGDREPPGQPGPPGGGNKSPEGAGSSITGWTHYHTQPATNGQ
jgi:hypothetical protein